MSWELASFLILGAVLVGGFAWYERSRPTSQIVALVAALAALAVAGRIAFAAIPNVVATTDIVLFAGYALGAAPGFAVGALAGLVSNFWLGQGPWTPWQMAGWGMCGIFGAALALGVRNAGRLTLATACGLAAVAYGALLNFSLMATYGGELSLERFLALEARAIPFELAHAVGNVVLALIAGPAMVRMLTRFRQRFEWRAPAVASLLLLALALATAPPGPGAGRRHRQDRRLARQRPERRRWLGAFDRQRLQPRDHRLGDARSRGRRAQPARHRPGRAHPGRLPARQRRGAGQQRRLRPHDSRSPGSGRRSAVLRRAQPRRRAARSASCQRLLRGLAGIDRLRGDRPALGRSHRQPRPHHRLARQSPEPRWRLG